MVHGSISRGSAETTAWRIRWKGANFPSGLDRARGGSLVAVEEQPVGAREHGKLAIDARHVALDVTNRNADVRIRDLRDRRRQRDRPDAVRCGLCERREL